MTKISLTVVPVALRPSDIQGSLPPLCVSTLRPGGRWLSTILSDSADVVGTALRIVGEAVHSEVKLTALENAGVIYDSGVPNLLVCMVLPIAAVELSETTEDWQALTPWVANDPTHSGYRRADPVQAAMIAYWQEQLARTTAALDFLPKYFPAAQVRSVYASVWGANASEGNFQRWLGSALDAAGDKLCNEVSDDVVRRENQTEFTKRLAGKGLPPTKVASLWDPKVVGLSASVVALAGIASLPVATVAGALTGAAIGWQTSRGSGRPPTWYQRARATRTALRATYPVRPPVTRWNSTLIE
ncbi:hypothetical protein ACFXQA_11355 [Microbacterium sp. P07]|uniref:hypothetical protein n=1 Tax=Microbacterium sp. P07 TaxID=3366952 RepID=UPI0037455517